MFALPYLLLCPQRDFYLKKKVAAFYLFATGDEIVGLEHVHFDEIDWLGAEGDDSGLSEEDYVASVATLRSIATTLSADCVTLRERQAARGERGRTGQYLIRRRAEEEDFGRFTHLISFVSISSLAILDFSWFNFQWLVAKPDISIC